MKKIVFLLFLLVSKLGYSQAIPADTDSVTIPIKWIEKANLDYNSYDQCIEQRDTLLSLVDSYRRQNENFIRLTGFLKSEIAGQEKIINNQTDVIFSQDKNTQSCRTKYIRMLRFKNIEIGVVLVGAGYLIWRITK